MKKTIDLGVSGEGKYYGSTSDKNDYKKKHYPVLYVSGVAMPDLPDEFYATVKLCKKTETMDYKTDDEDGDASSCSFEVKEMTVETPALKSGEKSESRDMGEIFIALVGDAMGKDKY